MNEEQPTLFHLPGTPTNYPPRPFAADSDTSWYAAHSIPEERLKDLERRVLGAHRSAYPTGLTDDELAAVLTVYRYTAAPRRKWLVEAGLIEDSGTTRPSPRNRPSAVWVWKPGGSFVEPAGTAELSTAKAIRQIYVLHVSVDGDPNSDFCAECGQRWPCPTNEIVERTRRLGVRRDA